MARGFTLVEMIIVLLIVGIVAMAGLPLLTASLSDAGLYAVTNEIVTAIEFAQISAISTGRPCRVTIDAVTETVKVEQVVYTNIAAIMDAGANELPEASIEASTVYAVMEYPTKPGTDYDIDLAANFSGADIVSVVLNSGENVVVFDKSGAPSEGASISIAYRGRAGSVSIEPVTGKVTQG